MGDICEHCGGELVILPEIPREVFEGLPKGPFVLACEEGCTEIYVPAEATARSRIGALRAIVRDHKARRVDGYIVDPTTAAMLCLLYDTLDPESRERFGKPSLYQLSEFCWRYVT